MIRTFLRSTSVLVLAIFIATAAFAQSAQKKSAAGTQTAKKPTGAKSAKPGTGGPAAPWKQIPVPPLPAFHPQEPKRIQLANGMVIFLQEDHELPVISGLMRIRGGSIQEPENKVGLIDVYGEVWRTGGTSKRSGDQLDDYLEARAAKVETGGGPQSTTISFNCLKDKLDEVFPIFLELLRDPAFREEKIELAKTQLNTGIARRNDDIGEIAGRESARLAYGRDNPYARIPEYSSVAAITRDDLVKWHQTFVHPNNIILGISGDFDPAAMESRLRQEFESWQKVPVPSKPNVVFHDPKPGLYFIEKSDVNQSDIRMVALGIQRNNPDYFAVEVMNDVLGGGFASRLFKSIRTEKGLAYSVGGGIGAAFDHPGMARFSMGTKSPSTVDAIQALRAELEGMVTKPATEEEVREAKDSILNRFIFNFDSKEKVLGERMLYEFFGYPADYLERFRSGIEKSRPSDVTVAAQKYIHPEQYAVLVVGNQAEFEKPLSTLGQVTPVDITILAPGAAPTASNEPKPTHSDPKARAMMEKFVNCLGGGAKVNAVKALQQTSVSTQTAGPSTITFNVETTTVFPDRIRAVARAEQAPGEMVVVASPQTSYMSMPGAGIREISGPLKEERLKNIRRDYLFVAQHLDDPSYVFTLGGNEEVGGAELPLVDIRGEEVFLRWALDPKTGCLLRSTYTALSGANPVQRTVSFSDWRPVEGLTLAFKRVIVDNGHPAASEEIKSYQINPPIDAKLFEKPAEGAAAPK